MTNVVLLSVDALSAGHVDFLGYDRPTMPELGRLAESGTTYTTCIAQSSHTRESVPSLFYSAYPLELGDVGPVPDDRPTIATRLSEEGFETAGFHSNPYLSRAYNFDRGFDTFDDSLALASNRLVAFLHRVRNHFRTRPYVDADELNQRGLSWLDERGSEDWFLWLHYMDPHGPYQPPKAFQDRFCDRYVEPEEAKRLWRRTVDEPETISADERETLADLYDAEIRYTDAMIGEFVGSLRERGLLEDTIVVVAADHGDLFGEHGRYGHPRYLYEELIHVPLVVLGPDVPAGVRIDRPVENVDVPPTILELLGVEVPEDFLGTSLPVSDDSGTSPSDRSVGDEPVAFAEAHAETSDERRVALRSSRYLFHATIDRDDDVSSEELFDLSSDGRRTDDGDVGTEESVKSILRNRLTDHVATVAGDGKRTGEDDVSSEVQARLNDLGYRD